MAIEVDEVKRYNPNETSHAKATVLDILAENKPYAFMTLEMGEDDEGTYFSVLLNTNVEDPTILQYMLDIALTNTKAAYAQTPVDEG
jgi:hypothetical protein